MKHLDLDVYEPGDQIATVSDGGSVVIYTVQQDGTLLRGKQTDLFHLVPDTIESLDLSVRAYNVLKREGINTISRLLEVYDEKGPDGMMNDFRNLGFKAQEEITAKVQEIRGWRPVPGEGGRLKP